MAAAVSPRPSASFDLQASAPYPIRLGRNLPSCSSVQYNHKPDLSDPEQAESSILPSRNGNKASLTLNDGDEKYTYSGRRGHDQDAYVLLLDDTTKEFSLERLTSSYAFNLTRAPWESDSEVLAERYPQLSPAGEHGEDMLEENGDSLDLDADADNPFDFRHYLDKVDSPSPTLQPAKGSTPALSQSSTRTNTPIARSARKQASAFAPQAAKPPPKARTKPKPVERQPRPQSPTRSPSPEPRRRREDVDVPSVRLDRRASTRIALPPKPAPKKQQAPREEEVELSLDADGDLILEGDDPPNSSYRGGKSSLGYALAGQLGEGPRSLRSAASSPAASHINSPAPRRPSPLGGYQQGDTDGEDIEIDIGPQEEEADIESDADVDGDVDDLQLPSPAQIHRHSTNGATVTGDDDDDLEKQMMLELEGALDDEGPSGQQGGAESDEESEEE